MEVIIFAGQCGGRMTAASILMNKHSPLLSFRPTTRVESIVELMTKNEVSSAVVVSSDGQLEGIVTERDILKAIDTKLSAIRSVQARDIMSHKVVTCAPDDTEETLMTRMAEGRVQHMPVVADNETIGIISLEELVERRVNKIKNMMREITDAIEIEKHLEYFTRHLKPLIANHSSARWPLRLANVDEAMGRHS